MKNHFYVRGPLKDRSTSLNSLLLLAARSSSTAAGPIHANIAAPRRLSHSPAGPDPRSSSSNTAPAYPPTAASVEQDMKTEK